MKNVMTLLIFVLFNCSVIATGGYPGMLLAGARMTDQRYVAFIKEIRCVVCQNQNIADSNAPLAKDLRKKIYQMMLDKKSDEEIKTYLVKRYGEFILLKPAFNKFTIILWIFPFLGIAMVFFIFLKTKKLKCFN